MPALKATEARRWLKITRDTLKMLCDKHPLGCRGAELPINDLNQSSRFRLLGKLVEAGVLSRDENHFYYAKLEAATELLKNNPAITALIWPKAPPPLQTFEAVDAAPVAPEPQEEMQLAMPSEPPPDMLAKDAPTPPPGASNEVVQQWIFTILHAQTQNLIYIRERVDKLMKDLGA